jgi:hypothetical protein
MRADITALRLATICILDNALSEVNSGRTGFHGNEWSVQGFGMLRLYIRTIGRLHIWDSALRYPNVSMIHNHSWDLKSTVVAGCIRNTRFTREPLMGRKYVGQRLVTGYNTRMVTPIEDVRLLDWPTETYLPGDVYAQRAAEIHRTDATDGTVTIMARNEDEQGEADVFWPADCTWGTAKPRPATPDEAHAGITKALAALEIML